MRTLEEMVVNFFDYHFFRSRHHFYMFDHGKEVIRYIKKIEKKISQEDIKLKILKKEILNKQYFRKSELKKTINLNRNFQWLSRNRLARITNLTLKSLHAFVSIKQKRTILNLCSKFLKFNFYFWTKKIITGFLIHYKPLRYSKFVISLNSPVFPKIKNILWNTLNYFNFFQIF